MHRAFLAKLCMLLFPIMICNLWQPHIHGLPAVPGDSEVLNPYITEKSAGAPGGIRTRDKRLKRALLYRLSY